MIVLPQASSSPLYAAPVYALPEDALSFTVDEEEIYKVYKNVLQPRGLLRLRESFTAGKILERTWRKIEINYIGLLFALKDVTDYQSWERRLLEEPKCRIMFDDIEGVTFKRWALRPRLVIKLKPEKGALAFEVDPVAREVVLYVSHKDAGLAQRLQSAMMAEVSNANLQRLLKR